MHDLRRDRRAVTTLHLLFLMAFMLLSLQGTTGLPVLLPALQAGY